MKRHQVVTAILVGVLLGLVIGPMVSATLRAQGGDQAAPAPQAAQSEPAEEKPIPLEPGDQQAIASALQAVQAYELAIAVLREKADAAAVAGRRAVAAAQAKHPNMPIDLGTGTYRPKPKDPPATEKR